MPVYEYRCRNCSHQFEVQQSFSDDALTRCPSCDQEQLRKVFAPVGITFKGSGFYRNDSRSGGSSSGGSSGSSTSSSSSSDSSSGSNGSSSSDSSSTTSSTTTS